MDRSPKKMTVLVEVAVSRGSTVYSSNNSCHLWNCIFAVVAMSFLYRRHVGVPPRDTMVAVANYERQCR